MTDLPTMEAGSHPSFRVHRSQSRGSRVASETSNCLSRFDRRLITPLPSHRFSHTAALIRREGQNSRESLPAAVIGYRFFRLAIGSLKRGSGFSSVGRTEGARADFSSVAPFGSRNWLSFVPSFFDWTAAVHGTAVFSSPTFGH